MSDLPEIGQEMINEAFSIAATGGARAGQLQVSGPKDAVPTLNRATRGCIVGDTVATDAQHRPTPLGNICLYITGVWAMSNLETDRWPNDEDLLEAFHAATGLLVKSRPGADARTTIEHLQQTVTQLLREAYETSRQTGQLNYFFTVCFREPFHNLEASLESLRTYASVRFNGRPGPSLIQLLERVMPAADPRPRRLKRRPKSTSLNRALKEGPETWISKYREVRAHSSSGYPGALEDSAHNAFSVNDTTWDGYLNRLRSYTPKPTPQPIPPGGPRRPRRR